MEANPLTVYVGYVIFIFIYHPEKFLMEKTEVGGLSQKYFFHEY